MPSLIRRFRPLAAVVALLAVLPLLSGCLAKSEHVGDQYSGFVVVAASPDVGPRPVFDVPASMTGSIQLTDYPSGDGQSTDSSDDEEGPGRPNGKVGSRLEFTDLTAGQFSQLGDIVSTALDQGASIDLSASRSDDIVRLRGGASLTGLSPEAYYISVTVDFNGPVVSTNGTMAGDDSVTWNPVPGQNVEFTADAKYPDPATAALPSWTLFVVVLSLAIVGLVAWLAYRFRDTASARYSPDQPVPVPGAKLVSRVREKASKKPKETSAAKSDDADT